MAQAKITGWGARPHLTNNQGQNQIVFAQNPIAGKPIEGAPVLDYYQYQAAQRVMPNVVGMPLERAKATLTQGGITGWGARPHPTNNQGQNQIVFAQNPIAGKPIEGAPVLDYYQYQASQRAMPNVIGQDLEQVGKMLTSFGNPVKNEFQKTPNQAQDNKIFFQNPNPGTPLPPTQTILLKAYKFETVMVTVPNVVGQGYIWAMETFVAAGLAPRRRDKETYDPKENEKVFGQGIAAGQKVPKGTVIDLIVLKLPPAEITVPNVVDIPYPEAANVLSRSLLTGVMVQTAEKTNDPQKNGKVFKQNPEAGRKVAKHTVVHLLLYHYESSNKVKVPNVVGMLAPNAFLTIKAAGLHEYWDAPVQSPGDKNQTGKIISQDPQPGQQVEKGSRVKVIIWIFPLKQPNVLGLPISEAERLARAGGFDNITVRYNKNTNKSLNGIVCGAEYPVDWLHINRRANFTVWKYEGP
ncbi:MAG: PASTA domain-containing protein [Pseudomonadota bacterium]